MRQGKLNITESGYIAYCPGCDSHHLFDRRWNFNGNFDKPTFSPSMLVDANGDRCHSFLTDGVWHFLDDCAHSLRGTNQPLERASDEDE
jgi:hypothetical protein